MEGNVFAAIVFLFFAGMVGWRIFAFLRFPASDLLGALFMGSIFGVLGWQLAFPSAEVTFISKLIIGSFIGLKVDQDIFRELKKISLPALLVSLWMLILSVVSGFMLYWWTDLSLPTSLLGGCTGGLTEMALMGFSFGADQVAITFLHLFRVVFFLFIMPIAASLVNRGDINPGDFARSSSLEEDDGLQLSRTGYNRLIMLLVAAVTGGITGRALGIPAGDLLGSMFTVGLCNVLWGRLPRVHPNLRILARIGVGLAIAQEISPKTVGMLSGMLLPVIILAVVMVLSGIILSLILYRVTNWNYSTCLLASSPGGLTQMTMIADEVGADPLTVSILHTVRLISVLTILPLFIRFLVV